MLGKRFAQSVVDDRSDLGWRLLLCCRLYAPYFQPKRWAELLFWLQNQETWVLSQWLLLFLFPERKKKKERIENDFTFDWCSHALLSSNASHWLEPLFLVSGVIVKKGENRQTFTWFRHVGGKETMKHLGSEGSVLSHPSVSVFSPWPGLCQADLSEFALSLLLPSSKQPAFPTLSPALAHSLASALIQRPFWTK